MATLVRAAEKAVDGRTFAVVLDTSGSMSRALLSKALGAIASYATAREVALVRVVFCDAAYYDQGYMPPEAIAGRVRVRGRGGTVLQPAIGFLERAEDFPKDGPVLIITDGCSDSFHGQSAQTACLSDSQRAADCLSGRVENCSISNNDNVRLSF